MEQERDFFTLLLMEGSTGAERKEFWGVEGQKEFAPGEMEHIQVWVACPVQCKDRVQFVRPHGRVVGCAGAIVGRETFTPTADFPRRFA